LPQPRQGGGHPHPRKRLGQHFLSDPRILARIADAADLAPDDTVVEIGPGRGALTEQLRERAARVIAVELDRALAATLRDRYAGDPRLTIVEGDVLDVDLGALAGSDYVLVGNVPYYITTPILFRALERPRPRRAIFLVQREVAERIAAPPGSEEYGALSVNVQAVARAELLFRVPPGAFYPPPTVDSAVIRITPLATPLVSPAEEEPFRIFVQEAFGMRRKQMRRVLRELWGLTAERAEAFLGAAAITPTARPEILSPSDFAHLLRLRSSTKFERL
jgi:16S rRNA (adenine1518-N6/adenine1519-N6)-dimethyltransferase